LPIEPCFRVQRLDHNRFRGSISGLGFAYCDFHQSNPRAQIISGPTAPDTTLAKLKPGAE
jgi:hypothetical protein